MARIRTVKPEFWVDEVMVELPFFTRLLFLGLFNFVDDEGYIEAKPRRIKMQIFPADDAMTLTEDSLNQLVEAGRLTEWDSDQGPLYQIGNFRRHQKINRPSPSRFTGIRGKTGIPAPDSVSPHGVVTEHSLTEGKGREGKGKEGKGKEDSFSSNVRHVSKGLSPEVELNESFQRQIVRGMGCDPAPIIAAIEEHLGHAPTDSELSSLCAAILTARPEDTALANPTGYIIGAIKNRKEQGKWRKVLAGEA